MSSVTIRALARNASGVVDGVVRTGRPAVVTRNGRPVAAVVPIDLEKLEDFILASAPEFVASRVEADAELGAGQTRPLEAVLAELGDEG